MQNCYAQVARMAEESRASLLSRFGGTVAVTPRRSTGNPPRCNRPPPRGCPTARPTPGWKGGGEAGFVGPIQRVRLVLDPLLTPQAEYATSSEKRTGEAVIRATRSIIPTQT